MFQIFHSHELKTSKRTLGLTMLAATMLVAASSHAGLSRPKDRSSFFFGDVHWNRMQGRLRVRNAGSSFSLQVPCSIRIGGQMTNLRTGASTFL
jgi:hypothetical protein